MKVCTDSCILGALAEHYDPCRIMDIGTGTGLLSLMLAQKYACPIDAIEIHLPSGEEAALNFSNSPWGHRLHLHQCRIQDFQSLEKYDIIISNPPFYKQHLKSNASHRNLALHNDTLSLTDLSMAISKYLASSGLFFVLLPPHESLELYDIVRGAGFYRNTLIQVRHNATSKVLREVSVYSLDYQPENIQDFTIMNDQSQYSKEFTNRLKPYYLYL